MNTCRFCGVAEFGSATFVKYGVRHYAHHACYLDAGKSLDDLQPWKVGNFPFRVLKDRGLLDRARQIIAADVAERAT